MKQRKFMKLAPRKIETYGKASKAVHIRTIFPAVRLLVQGLGVGGGGRDVGVTGSLVRAGGELELVGGLEVGIAGGAVGGGVILEVEKESEHFCSKEQIRRPPY